ncbi:hypothetical protein CDD83_3142 [Cordyceps sp. RAO-2017]|nr:hypothetical protein CDD83_3142 [Cordyceps sp. RAO-2017]
MRPRLVEHRLWPATRRHRALPHRVFSRRGLAGQATVQAVKARPVLPFLLTPKASPSVARSFTSERKRWLKHEARLVVRYTVTLWGVVGAVLVFFFAIGEEALERRFPTPPEWNYFTRKCLRDANQNRNPKNGEINWPGALELARLVLSRLEDPAIGGDGVAKLLDGQGQASDVPGEFVPCDISAKSEAWRRGYVEAMMLAAKAAEHVDGWVRDRTRNLVSRPEYVIGPSNPRPKPIAPGNPHAPREEDCDPAFPAADNWYMKILATKGLTARQRMEAALEYASFMDYKRRPDGVEALFNLALAEATQGLPPSSLPYDPKTLVLANGEAPASMNVLDVLTAMANYKARRGHVFVALPIYISLLKNRRALSDAPPSTAASSKPRDPSMFRQMVALFAPPDYPAPPPDGTRPPPRDLSSRCQEAALHLYIGEILYATSSKVEGLSWTREGVDLAEEQLRAAGQGPADREAKQTCRECLTVGLDNWSIMVSRLAKREAERNKAGAKSKPFSLWSGEKDAAEGRWTAEEAVVQERVRRTKELLEDLTPPPMGPLSFFKA